MTHDMGIYVTGVHSDSRHGQWKQPGKSGLLVKPYSCTQEIKRL